MSDEPQRQEPATQVVFDGDGFTVETHPQHGVIIRGTLGLDVVDGEPVFVPLREPVLVASRPA